MIELKNDVDILDRLRVVGQMDCPDIGFLYKCCMDAMCEIECLRSAQNPKCEKKPEPNRFLGVALQDIQEGGIGWFQIDGIAKVEKAPDPPLTLPDVSVKIHVPVVDYLDLGRRLKALEDHLMPYVKCDACGGAKYRNEDCGYCKLGVGQKKSEPSVSQHGSDGCKGCGKMLNKDRLCLSCSQAKVSAQNQDGLVDKWIWVELDVKKQIGYLTRLHYSGQEDYNRKHENIDCGWAGSIKTNPEKYSKLIYALPETHKRMKPEEH